MTVPVALSVVLPVGSAGPELAEAVAAVAGQRTSFPFEVILSLNSRDDDVTEQSHELSLEYQDVVRVVDSADRRGPAHARNVGSRHARADTLAFCDGDDVAGPGWLQSLVDSLGELDAVSGRMDESRFSIPGQEHWRPPATPDELPSFLGVPYLLSGNLIITREALEAVGGFDTTLTRCEDIALGWALTKARRRFGFAPNAVVHYRPRAGLVRMMRQHYMYGRGMSEVIYRYGVPNDGESRPMRLLVTANAQPVRRRSGASSLRRASIAAGRVRGMSGEFIASVAGRQWIRRAVAT